MPIFHDIARALSQIFDRRFLWVALKSIGLTLLLLIGTAFGFSWLIGALFPETLTLPVVGEIAFLGALLSVAAIPLVLILSIFLMIPVAALFMGFFLDDIADAVDRRHYPGLPKPPPLNTAEILIDALRFAAVFLLVNLIALIIYVASTLLAPVIFWIVNGYLLSREYFHQVALRRMEPKAATALRRKHRFAVWVAGILLTIPLTIPILNLVVPMIGIATFTHMVERLRR